MKNTIVKFLNVGIYTSKEQVVEIMTMNMNYTIITPAEFEEIMVEVEKYFTPPIQVLPYLPEEEAMTPIEPSQPTSK